MHGVESPTSAPQTGCALGASDRLSPPGRASAESEPTCANRYANGFVATAQEILTEALTDAGFVHTAAGASVNFALLVGDSSTDGSELMADLDPGLAAEFVSRTASQIAGDADVPHKTQAHIDPRRAVALLM